MKAAPASRIRPAAAKVIREKKIRTPRKTNSATRARRPNRPVKTMQPSGETIAADARVLSTRPAPAWRSFLRKHRRILSWALVIGVALLDPGLILAMFMALAAAAVSIFALGVIATTLTTVALLNRWRPGRYGQILRHPPKTNPRPKP